MPLVRIDLVGGRRPELLRDLIGNVHRTVVDTLGVPESTVTVIVNEVPAELWASGGTTKAEQRAATPSASQPTHPNPAGRAPQPLPADSAPGAP